MERSRRKMGGEEWKEEGWKGVEERGTEKSRRKRDGEE